MGVLDEDIVLNYGEVFVQITNPETKQLQVITGKVFVVRNPCFHPGDILVLNAVDIRTLHYRVDCVVFPAQGIYLLL